MSVDLFYMWSQKWTQAAALALDTLFYLSLSLYATLHLCFLFSPLVVVFFFLSMCNTYMLLADPDDSWTRLPSFISFRRIDDTTAEPRPHQSCGNQFFSILLNPIRPSSVRPPTCNILTRSFQRSISKVAAHISTPNKPNQLRVHKFSHVCTLG